VSVLTQRIRRGIRDKITLQDVAAKAGVSAITVSRALREPEKVSEYLREEILRIVQDMGYVPDLNARALASGTSAFIGVLIPSLTHAAIPAIVSGIEKRVRGTEYRIQYANTHYDSDEEINQLRLFAAQRPVGVIVCGVQHSENLNAMMKEAGCPIVQTVDVSLGMDGIAVAINHKEAAMAATTHLLSQGYRRIGLIGGGYDVRVRQRQAGYIQAMREAGLFDERLIVSQDAPTSIHLGSRLLRRFLETQPDADGVLCHSDDLALGAIFECNRLGIRIPEDFGICGFNDLDFAASTEPPLTTVHVPRFEIGYRAADVLIAIGNGKKDTAKSIDLGFELKHRATTRRLRTALSA
jgi:LacI family gluconate utilization system Gnt-I transcriptional repressor